MLTDFLFFFFCHNDIFSNHRRLKHLLFVAIFQGTGARR